MKTALQILFFLFIFNRSNAQPKPHFSLNPKASSTMELKMQQCPFTPAAYTLEALVDARTDRSDFASIYRATGLNTVLYSQRITLKGGLITALNNFISSLHDHEDKPLRLLLLLKTCRLIERKTSRNEISGSIQIVLGLARLIGQDTLFLTNWSENSSYLRSPGVESQIEPSLRKVFMNALVYMDLWIKAGAESNSKLARAVSISCKDYTDTRESDTIYYRKERPLRWEDFKEVPPLRNRFGAEIFPIFSYLEHTEVVHGIINVHLSIRAAIAKSNSWAKESIRTAYSLKHEQLHFDLIQIAANHFQKNLLEKVYSIENYDGEISAQYLEAYREMTRSEQLYDEESNHGENESGQEQWRTKIEKLIQ